MSLLGYPKVIPYTKFEHFGIIRFYDPTSEKMHLVTPMTLTFQPQNHITSRISQGHFLYQVWTLWDHLFSSYAADKQTEKPDRQTDGLNRPKHGNR